jgi:hypothetical protein
MKFGICFLGVLICVAGLRGQEVDSTLIRLNQRLDSVTRFEADVRMEVDISFVNMPVKHARVRYERGAPINVSSEDFVMIPKRGLDLTFAELFREPFMTLNLGKIRIGNRQCEQIKVIPATDASEYTIATLWVDPAALQVIRSQISTRKNGVYTITYSYSGVDEVLPEEIEVELAVTGIKIPLRFLGKDTSIDRDKMKEDPEQQGKIYLTLTNYRVSRM